MSTEPEDEDFALHCRLTVFFMTLALAAVFAVCSVSMCLLMGLPIVEGITVALLLAGLVVFLGGQDEALQTAWLEGVREDWDAARRAKPPRPKDGYYGW